MGVRGKCPLASQEPHEIEKQFFPCAFQGVSRSQGHFADSHSDHGKPGTRRVQSLVKGTSQAESEPGRDSQAWSCLAGEGQGLRFGKVPEGLLLIFLGSLVNSMGLNLKAKDLRTLTAKSA